MNIDDGEVRERVMPIIAKAREDKGRAGGEARREGKKIEAQARGKVCGLMFLIGVILTRDETAICALCGGLIFFIRGVKCGL